MIAVSLMGGLRVCIDGEPVRLGGPRQRTVLALLALSMGRPVDASRLESLVWGDAPPASARSSLQSYISNLRRALAPAWTDGGRTILALGPGGYSLDLPLDAIDIHRFERTIRAGLAARAAGDGEEATALLDRALRSAAPLLPEFAAHPCVTAAARHLETITATATEVALELQVERGEHLAALPLLRAAVDEHPRHERLWAALALALYRSGRQAEAIATVHAARQTLRDLAGIEPGPELRRLEAELLVQSPALERDPADPGTRASVIRRDGPGSAPVIAVRCRPAPRFRPRACAAHLA